MCACYNNKEQHNRLKNQLDSHQTNCPSAEWIKSWYVEHDSSAGVSIL